MEQLSKLLLPYANQSDLECDGLSRILHSVLVEEGIEHTVWVGAVLHCSSQRQVPLHFWLDLNSGWRVDYRLQMWLGTAPDIPHGIFHPQSFASVCYNGKVVEQPVLPKPMTNILLMPLPR